MSMTQPLGFMDSSHPDFVCKLDKSLYGLKQSLRAWFHKLISSLVQCGFQGSQADTSMFMLQSPTTFIMVIIYMDDIIVTSPVSSHIQRLIKNLQSHFALKDLGDLHYFLGVEAHRTSIGLHLS